VVTGCLKCFFEGDKRCLPKTLGEHRREALGFGDRMVNRRASGKDQIEHGASSFSEGIEKPGDLAAKETCFSRGTSRTGNLGQSGR
jgi:hypothetical protein